MADYKVIIPFILKWEGGFANDPDDRGGATNKGVTIATFRQVYGKQKTVADLKNITTDQWNYIFKKLFWDKCKCDGILDQSVANIIVDYAWGSGSARAVKDVQAIVGTAVDGISGPKTVAAINGTDAKTLFNKIKERRIQFYNNIVKANPSQKKFLRGWTNRVNSLVYGKPYWK